MANKSPVITPEFERHKIKPIGTNEKMGNKVYGTRVPLAVQEKLEAMPQKDRVILIRQAIINAVNSDEN